MKYACKKIPITVATSGTSYKNPVEYIIYMYMYNNYYCYSMYKPHVPAPPTQREKKGPAKRVTLPCSHVEKLTVRDQSKRRNVVA